MKNLKFLLLGLGLFLLPSCSDVDEEVLNSQIHALADSLSYCSDETDAALVEVNGERHLVNKREDATRLKALMRARKARRKFLVDNAPEFPEDVECRDGKLRWMKHYRLLKLIELFDRIEDRAHFLNRCRKGDINPRRIIFLCRVYNIEPGADASRLEKLIDWYIDKAIAEKIPLPICHNLPVLARCVDGRWKHDDDDQRDAE